MDNIQHYIAEIRVYKKQITIGLYVILALLLINAITGFPFPSKDCSHERCSLVEVISSQINPENIPFSTGSGTLIIKDQVNVLSASLVRPLVGSGGVLEEETVVERVLSVPIINDTFTLADDRGFISKNDETHLYTVSAEYVRSVSAELLEEKYTTVAKELEDFVDNKLPLYAKNGSELALVKYLNEVYGNTGLFEVNSLEKADTELSGEYADSKRFTITIGTNYEQLKTFFSDVAASYRVYEMDNATTLLPLMDIYSVKITPPLGGNITTAANAEITLDLFVRKVNDELYTKELLSLTSLEEDLEKRLLEAGTLEPITEEKIATLKELISTEKELMNNDVDKGDLHEALSRIATITTLLEEILKLLS